MPELRVTIEAPDAEIAGEVKEQFFKDLYEHNGSTVIFEVPIDAQEKADAIIAWAKEKGCKGSSEEHADSLDDAEPVSFW